MKWAHLAFLASPICDVRYEVQVTGGVGPPKIPTHPSQKSDKFWPDLDVRSPGKVTFCVQKRQTALKCLPWVGTKIATWAPCLPEKRDILVLIRRTPPIGQFRDGGAELSLRWHGRQRSRKVFGTVRCGRFVASTPCNWRGEGQSRVPPADYEPCNSQGGFLFLHRCPLKRLAFIGIFHDFSRFSGDF